MGPNRPLTIQGCPRTQLHLHGSSGYVGAVIPLSADRRYRSLRLEHRKHKRIGAMQSTREPWSGIWLQHADTERTDLLAALENAILSITLTRTVGAI